MPRPLLQAFRIEPSFWIPEPNQSLVDVVASVYGIYPCDRKSYNTLLYFLHRLNPQVLNVNVPLGRIVLKTIDLHISGPRALDTADPEQVIQHLQRQFQLQDMVYQRLRQGLPHKPVDIEGYRMAAGFLSMIGPNSLTLGGLGTGMMHSTTSAPLQFELKNLLEVHQQVKTGRLNARQFKLQQELIIRRIKKALGWTERLHFGGKTARQALYSSYSHGLKPTLKVMDQLDHIKFLNGATKGGGFLLTAIGMKMSCDAIREAKADKRVQVAYHEIGGLGGAIAGGFIFGVLEFSGPIGWVVGIAITLGSGYLSSKVGSAAGDYIHSHYGDIFQLSNSALISNWCAR